MPSSVETSALDSTNTTDPDSRDAALRNRLGDTTDIDDHKKTKVNETTVESPVLSSNDTGLDDDVEYVKGHPVIKTGTQSHRFIAFLKSAELTIRKGYDVSKFLVSVRDDGDPSFTFRSILLGTAFTALSSVITMLYVFKPVQMQVSAVFIQRKLRRYTFAPTTLLAYPWDSTNLHLR